VKLARERAGCADEEIGHTLALAVWGNRGPTIVHWEESPQAVTVNLRLGDVMPLLSSATGRCFAAYVSRDAMAPMLRDEMARAQGRPHRSCPPPWPKSKTMLAEVRTRRMARVVDTCCRASWGSVRRCSIPTGTWCWAS
jgi:DNA-binding IclR family transcriptional regulator